MKPVIYKDQIIGKETKTDKFHVFFGNRFSTEAILSDLFPAYRFHFLKQVHGNKVEKAPAQDSADGHWTDQKNQALAVYTADCLPILAYNGTNVAALHAGWRGLVSEIILESSKVISLVGSEVQVFIGPHLQFENFEVHLDVAQKLKSVGPADIITRTHSDPKKCYVNLSLIARYQLKKTGAKAIAIDTDNTYNNENYLSYRFDGPGCGRLISFVVKI